MAKQHVHFIGIGGTGLSAIALVLLESGYQVSGSDRQMTPLAASLQAAGVSVTIGHAAENVRSADVVVRSSAIPDDHVEVQVAQAAGIPVLKRIDFLEQILAGKICLAVAGTHGKTTTTAMLAWILSQAGMDPSYIIGGVATDLDGNAHAGNGNYFIIEADEYDRMFHGVNPTIAVVTNVEHDHPDCYPTRQDFYQAFVTFTDRLLPGGVLVACADDAGALRLAQEVSAKNRVVLYGIHFPMTEVELDFAADNIKCNELGGFSFDVRQADRGLPMAHIDLAVPGLHNVQNALAAIAVAHQIKLPYDDAVRALTAFHGTGRRFELRGEAAGVTVIDDYAHHPTEIRTTLAAARTRYPGRRLWVVWQPHTYSRILTLWDEFTHAFVDADGLLVTSVYAAREQAPAGFDLRKLVTKIDAQGRADVHYLPGLVETSDFLLKTLHAGDVLLVLSAGDADQVSRSVLAGLTRVQENENAG